jgi:hypothetical protein
MEPSGYHLAQVNIALLKAPLESPLLASFVEALDPVNAVADASPGFVWRLQTDDGDATAIRAFGDDRIIVNMSVWESAADLKAFVLWSPHRQVLRRRLEWFHRVEEASVAMWWIPVGHVPTVAEAEERVAHIRGHGPTEFAFDFRHSFPAPAFGTGGEGVRQGGNGA